MEKMYDLAYSQQPDGSVRLVQSDCGDEYIIDLHPAQLRHLAEHFELVPPAPPADDLTKRLVEQLGRVFLDMSDDYRHLTHTLEFAFARIDGFLETLPDDVFPFTCGMSATNESGSERRSRKPGKRHAMKPVSGPHWCRRSSLQARLMACKWI